MNVAIIGAGKMGRWFTKFFLQQGDSVIVSSRSKEKLSQLKKEFNIETTSNVDAVKRADRILICVPPENFEDVIKEIYPHIQPAQLIMDICSVKEIPVKIMHDYINEGITLGMHPMFGPGAKSIKNQNVILTPISKKEKMFANHFKSQLEEKGANVFIMSPKRHDDLMSMVLGLPHFLGLVICDTLLAYGEYPEMKKIGGASFKLLTTLAETVASEKPEFYASLQMMLPKTGQIESLFLKKSEEWLNMVKQRDKSAFAEKMRFVKRRLIEVNPRYTESYEIMHRLLEVVKN